MGPAGSGKTTIGELLAAQLGWQFADGDNFHSPVNIQKISHGIPLTDSDRLPWLDSIREAISEWLSRHKNVVLACSALKRTYRDRLLISPDVKLVYLKGSYDLLRQRLHARKGHYATEQILTSQFTDLEEPTDALIIDVSPPPQEIAAEIRTKIGLT